METQETETESFGFEMPDFSLGLEDFEINTDCQI